MKKEKAQHVWTNMGFDWGNMAVERCLETDGHLCIRIRAMNTGKFIDVQMSKGGKNIFAYSQNQSDSLKGFNPGGTKRAIMEAVVKVIA